VTLSPLTGNNVQNTHLPFTERGKPNGTGYAGAVMQLQGT